jgi:glycosyl transferase, family 25
MPGHLELLNRYFDKIFVLSVEAATNRRELFTERFKGLNYSFFFGADKNKFIIPELIEKGIYSETLTRVHHRYDKDMKPGEIACAWSHRMIYEDIVMNNHQRVLIFEDDAVPNPCMIERIPEIIEEIPEDCELLLWGWSKNGENGIQKKLKQSWYHIQHSRGMLKWDHVMINNLYAKPFSKNLKKAGFHDYSYAYSVTREGAQKLLNMQTPIQYVADNLLAIGCTRQIVNGYITYPVVFHHDSLPDGTPRDSYIR